MPQPPSGTVTFLFTDIEGSTRRWEDDPEAMQAMLSGHDAGVRRVIEKHHGHVFKHTGDGVAAVFASTSDAVAASIDAQRLVRDVLPVRMGLHTGEAELRDGDYYGSTLNRCARLMGVAHAGQVLASNATAALFGARPADGVELVELGTVRLRGLSQPEVVFQVVVDGLPQEFAALEGQALDTLPRPRTSLVGRDDAAEEVLGLLLQERAVTLAGVGGTGKTRLAIEVGRRCLTSFPDGVIFVALADVDRAEGVPRAIADAADLRGGSVLGSDGPLDHRELVLRALAHREAVLVVDNCEHLLDPVAELVDAILERSPGIRVVATSREPLGINGERVWRVPSLDDNAAVELLVDRARASGADVHFTTAERDIATELCRRLDGLPLAIELAAARFRAMSVAEVAARLDDRFRLLAGRGRAHDRHATLRATLDWSFDLLLDEEQLLLARLSVFAGGFVLEAAESVCGTAPLAPAAVMDLLIALVDKSLVDVGERDGHTRYTMLETVRAYAAERLADRDETAATSARHADWAGGLAQAFWIRLATRGDALDDDSLVRESDNARAAHTWMVEQANAPDAQAIASALAMSWYQRGNPAEGLRRCEEALAIRTGDQVPLTQYLCHCTAAWCMQWLALSGWQHGLAALQLADAHPDLPAAFVWFTLSTCCVTVDAPDGPDVDECVARARALDDTGRLEGLLLLSQGQHRLRVGRLSEAKAIFEQSLSTDTNPSARAWCRLVLLLNRYVLDGEIALSASEIDQICTGDAAMFPIAHGLQAVRAALNGERAHEFLSGVVASSRRIGWSDAHVVEPAAAVAMHSGAAATAARLLGSASDSSVWANVTLSRYLQPLVRDALGEADFDRLFAEGQQLDEADAIALALSLP